MKPITSLITLVLIASACAAPDPDTTPDSGDSPTVESSPAPSAERLAEVAAAGAAVMPFDLDRSTHVFESTPEGGVQTVVSNDGDEDQIAAIRAHLSEEAERFSRGDFHDPAMIHGDDMAGMHALVTGAERMTIEYREVEGGGEIRYSSEDPALVEAIHQWFDQQLSDHGEHARGR